MLKTSSTKSIKQKKGVVGAGDSRKKHGNRVKPVSRDEITNIEDGNNKVRKKSQKMSKSKNLF